MKTSELREKSAQDLRDLSDERRRELFDLRFKHYTGQLLDTAALKKTRRDIARIETVLREVERAQVTGA
ncbi:MAG: 50S ribosomal protein L29 [Bradymonadia bacterium]